MRELKPFKKLQLLQKQKKKNWSAVLILLSRLFLKPCQDNDDDIDDNDVDDDDGFVNKFIKTSLETFLSVSSNSFFPSFVPLIAFAEKCFVDDDDNNDIDDSNVDAEQEVKSIC